MLSLVIAVENAPAGLAESLATLIPAIPQGVLRDGCVLDPAADGEMEAIADAAGCRYRAGALAQTLPPALAEAECRWLLLMRSGYLLEEGWWRECARYIESPPTRRGGRAAVFSHVDPRYGLWPRLLELAWRHVPVLRSAGVCLVPAARVESGRLARFPALVRGRMVTLRTRATAPAN